MLEEVKKVKIQEMDNEQGRFFYFASVSRYYEKNM